MKIRRIIYLISALVILTAAAFPATAVYGNGTQDILKYTDDIIGYSVKASGSNDVSGYINGYLADNAAVLSEWMVISLARTERGYDFRSYVSALNDYLKVNKVESASKRLLYSLSLLCCGDTENEYIDRSVNDSIGELGVMSYIYGLHMLNNGYTSDKFTVSDVISQLLSMRLEDGGWALFGKVSDVDVSAMTVQALAPYYKTDKNVKKAVDEAMDLLSSRQLDDGSYKGFGKENCESTAQVAIAMAALGIDRNNDKRFIKNGKNIIDGILKFRLEDDSYCHVVDGGYNFMATVQAMMAYISFYRAEKGMSSFYSIRKSPSYVVTETTAPDVTRMTTPTVPATAVRTTDTTVKPTSKTTAAAEKTTAVTTKTAARQTTASVTKSTKITTLQTTEKTVSATTSEPSATELTTTLTSVLISETTASNAADITYETTPSVQTTAADATDTVAYPMTFSSEEGNDGNKSSALTIVIISAAGLIVAASAVFLIVKKKSK